MEHSNTLSQYEQSDAASLAEDPEAVVVFTWAVPRAAKVPVPRQHAVSAAVLVQPAAVSSTVPAALVTELRVNNTALCAGWCRTATLAAPLRRVQH